MTRICDSAKSRMSVSAMKRFNLSRLTHSQNTLLHLANAQKSLASNNSRPNYCLLLFASPFLTIAKMVLFKCPFGTLSIQQPQPILHTYMEES
mmetsp:Transcript_34030/g.57777  ORF Transcript_34030/g.57777 Transcript_34030/m.57777 type:complete len:93 (+) Transcript_34030:283-561(+)